MLPITKRSSDLTSNPNNDSQVYFVVHVQLEAIEVTYNFKHTLLKVHVQVT